MDTRYDSNASVTLGGIQDVGQARAPTGQTVWTVTQGVNDLNGWDVAFDAVNLSQAYASTGPWPAAPFTRVFRSSDNGQSWPTQITPWGAGSDTGSYIAPIAVDPRQAGVLYVGGSQNLWQSLDAGATWRIIHTAGGNGPVAVAKANSNHLAYASDAGVLVSTNVLAGAPTFTNITRNLPMRKITRVAIDPNDPAVILATLGGFGGGHIFRTTIGGTTWRDISPPVDIPVNAIALDGVPVPTGLYIGTDLGVMRSVDGGNSWTRLDDLHLPKVPVTDLAFKTNSGILRVATFGRGAFELKDPDGPIIALNAENGLQFGSVCANDVARLTLQLFNVGTNDLFLHSIYRLNGDTNFSVQTHPSLPLVLGPREEVDFTVEFRPATNGAYKATLRLSSNDPTVPWVDLPVTASGTNAVIVTSIPHGGSFGEAAIHRPFEDCGLEDLPLTINNPGPCDLVISGIISSRPAEFFPPDTLFFPMVVHPGDSTTVWLRFAPLSLGTRTATLSVINNSWNAPGRSFPVAGLGRLDKRLATVIADSGAFGEVPPCEFRDLPLTLNNSGICPLTIFNLAWSQQLLCCSNLVTPGTNMLMTTNVALVTNIMQDSFTGLLVTNVGFVTNLNAFFADPRCLTNLVFTTKIVTLTNLADGTVTSFTNFFVALDNQICAVRLFDCPSVMNFPLVIAPGDSLQIPVRFQPKTCCANQCLPLGVNFGSVTIFSDDPVNPSKVIPLRGVVKDWQRAVTLMADDGNFGLIPSMTFEDLPLVINNAGGCDLVISNLYCTTNLAAPTLVPFVVPDPLECSGQFLLPTVLRYPLVIHPGDSIELPIRFAPATGTPTSFTNLLVIFSNDPKAPLKFVTVLGTEGLPNLAVALAASAAAVPLGSNLIYTFTVTNSGPVAATGVGLTATLPPNATIVSVPAGCVVVDGGLDCRLGQVAVRRSTNLTLIVSSSVCGGTLVNTATVRANEADPVLSNNSATVTTLVADVTPPVVICSPDQVIHTTNAGGAVVTYGVIRSDNCPGVGDVTCVPPPGALFPSGVTLVNCLASDARGNSNTCRFAVTVTVTVTNPPSVLDYSQDFPCGGPTTNAPPGWFVGYGSPTSLTAVGVSDGTLGPDQTAGWYFGPGGSTDCALGTMATINGSPAPPSGSRHVEVRLPNSTGYIITAITVRYDGEQWRTGSTNTVNSLILQHSSDGSNYLNLGAAFNFVQRTFTPGNGALDGNAPANRTANIGGTFTLPVPLPPGGVIYLRWLDLDNPGTDPALAVDNFSFNATVTLDPLFVAIPSLTEEQRVPTEQNIAVGVQAIAACGFVTRVDVYVDGVLVGSAATAPYSILVPALAAGPHTLFAVAVCSGGAQAGSLPVNINVVTNQPPSIILSNSAPALLVGRATANQVIVTDDFGVAAVDMYVNDSFSFRDGTAPFGPYLYRDLPAGEFRFQAVATDNGGSSGTSAVVTVMVTNSSFTVIVSNLSEWSYLDNGSDQGTNWISPAFDDSGWASGRALLGYGSGDERTTNSFGPDPNHKYITTYYRRAFTVQNPAQFTNLIVSLLRDDGGMVYLNGVEIFRSNMPTGPIDYLTLASLALDDGTVYFRTNVDAARLMSGTNVLAVEIHQNAIDSSDTSFDLMLWAQAPLSCLLALTDSGGGFLITWPCGGTLESTDNLTSPPGAIAWQAIPGATSPYAVSFTGMRRFYRVRTP